MKDTVDQISTVALRLQSLLKVMDVAAIDEAEQGSKHKEIWWGGLFDLADEQVEKILVNASELESHFIKQEAKRSRKSETGKGALSDGNENNGRAS